MHTLDDLSSHPRDILVHDLVEGLIVCQHTEVSGCLNEKVVDRLIPADTLLLRLRPLQIVEIGHHLLALLLRRLFHPCLNGPPLQGRTEFCDLIHVDLLSNVHERQHLRQDLVKMSGDIVSRTLLALQNSHVFQDPESLSRGIPADLQLLGKFPLREKLLTRLDLPASDSMFYIFNDFLVGFLHF